MELACSIKLPVATILISSLGRTCPCCLEMLRTVRAPRYLRVPGFVPLPPWACSAVMPGCTFVTNEARGRVLNLLPQSEVQALSLILFLVPVCVQNARTCTRDDQVVVWTLCFISVGAILCQLHAMLYLGLGPSESLTQPIRKFLLLNEDISWKLWRRQNHFSCSLSALLKFVCTQEVVSMKISEAACVTCCIKETSIILNTRIKEKATEVEIYFQRICWQTFCIVPSLPCCNWFRRVRHLASAGLSLTEINLFLQACFLLPWSQLNCVGTPWLWAEPARGWWHDAGTALEQHWCRLTSADLEMPIHQRK